MNYHLQKVLVEPNDYGDAIGLGFSFDSSNGKIDKRVRRAIYFEINDSPADVVAKLKNIADSIESSGMRSKK